MYSSNFYPKALKPLFENLNFCLTISHIRNYISRKRIVSNPAIEFCLNEAEESHFTKPQFISPAQNEEQFVAREKDGKFAKVQISHPGSEWVNLMEVLLKKGYFDGTSNPFANNGELGKKEANLIRTASLNFARDQYQLIRYLSRKDIGVIAGSGCPSIDKKVINSGKRLRAHVGIEEGTVCSSCILRGGCDRAYVKARRDEGCRTVDVMRLLVTYCLDPILGSVENRLCLNKKVKESVRTLVKEMVSIRVVEHDHEMPKAYISDRNTSSQENDIGQERNQISVPMKQGDWICPKCKFLNFARNVKCLRCDCFSQERIKALRAEQDHLPLKKGDWMCDKCNFLNFARNTKCYQCKEKAPNRQLNPGEWECESCNYLNFRRNMVCLKCDHKRPIASNTAGDAPQFVSNNEKNHKGQYFFDLQDQGGKKCDNSIKFIDDGWPDESSPSSWNPDIMDFPIMGGKSDLSRNGQKQESVKLEMFNRSRTGQLTSDDDDDDDDGSDDDEMAKWFTGGKTL